MLLFAELYDVRVDFLETVKLRFYFLRINHYFLVYELLDCSVPS